MILGVGIDIIEVARIQGSFEKFGERFVKRILHPDEFAYCLPVGVCRGQMSKLAGKDVGAPGVEVLPLTAFLWLNAPVT